MSRRHVWVLGADAESREQAIDSLELPPRRGDIEAHRRWRGPYTFGGSVARQHGRMLVGQFPELVARHATELLSVAPELTSIIEGAPSEPGYTRRIAQGLTELLTSFGTAIGGDCCYVVEHADEADATDAELLAVVLGRMDPALFQLVVCTGPADGVRPELREALAAHAHRVDAPSVDPEPLPEGCDMAAAYVEGDCISDDARLLSAYDRLSSQERAALHDAQAAALAARGAFSFTLGAIPFHLERGSDPRGAGAAALVAAKEYCERLGFAEAAADLAARLEALAQ
jgi:hypothetical protein